jgi:demethoxyubiquinone hydroxylase (CLK1/Coq7/Cat5 family)
MNETPHQEHEALNTRLLDNAFHAEYKQKGDGYRVGAVATALGRGLIWLGTIVYGKKPSYEKFKAIEVIARIPYQSWEVATYTLLTALYENEEKAIALSKEARFIRIAQDNETMHVVVLSQLVKERHGHRFLRHTLVPLLFSFIYFWITYLLYLLSRKRALEVNYLFESHAYEQYSRFLKENEESLKAAPLRSKFLDLYGRTAETEYELFLGIRNDELIHRNGSIGITV